MWNPIDMNDKQGDTDMTEKLMTPVEKIMAESRNEVNEEIMEKFKGEVKAKMKTLALAKKAVANIEREIEDLQVRINRDLS